MVKQLTKEEREKIASLSDTLEDGAGADVWYDAAYYGEDSTVERIEEIKEAMRESAQVLRNLIGVSV